MRFCRSCGNRLGEGPPEYTETVRFADQKAATDARFAASYGPSVNAPIAPAAGSSFAPRKRRLGLTGMTWMWIILGLFFATGGILSMFRRNNPNRPPRLAAVVNRSYFGVNEFEDAEGGGVTFRNVWPPGSPADKAGLVGGDVITAFDNHSIKDEDEITEYLRQTPVGKTVEIIYVRDGETKKTMLITVSREDFNKLGAAFESRPEGQGQLGFDDDESERVPIPGTKIYGVELGGVTLSGPAALAGIEKGDVIIEFDGTPIRTVGELVTRVRRAIPYSTVKVVVMRGTEQVEIPVKIGKRG
jgi:membrane-associated protease RseP (regulator of RpoE activity)